MDILSSYFSECKTTLEFAALTTCNEFWTEKNVVSKHNCIYYILDGEGKITVNGIDYYPVKGDLVVLPYGATIDYGPINDNYYTKYWCHFIAKCGSVNFFDLINVPFCTHIEDDTQIMKHFEELVIQPKTPFDYMHLNAILLDLLVASLSAIGTERINFNYNVPIKDIEILNTFIMNHLDQVITLKQLSELIHYHPNYLITFFRKYFNTTPAKYINRIKIEKAKELLISTDYPIIKIATMLGFNSEFHFSGRFKDAVGISPSSYRKNISN